MGKQGGKGPQWNFLSGHHDVDISLITKQVSLRKSILIQIACAKAASKLQDLSLLCMEGLGSWQEPRGRWDVK